MKRLLYLILFLCLLVARPSLAQTVQLTGKFQYPDGTGVNGRLEVGITRLNIRDQCNSGQIVPQSKVRVQVINGTITSSPSFISSDCMVPQALYEVRLFDSTGRLLFEDNWFITGNTNAPTQDVGNSQKIAAGPNGPITFVVPVLQAPSVSQQVIQPLGTTFTIGGVPLTFQGLTTGQPLSIANNANIFYDKNLNSLQVSLNGAAYQSLTASAFYQTVQNNLVSVTQRHKLNFPGGGCLDNAGNDSTDCTVTGSGTFYQTFKNAGSALTQRASANFPSGWCVDNGGTFTTDCLTPSSAALTDNSNIVHYTDSGTKTFFNGSTSTWTLSVGSGNTWTVNMPTAALAESISITAGGVTSGNHQGGSLNLNGGPGGGTSAGGSAQLAGGTGGGTNGTGGTAFVTGGGGGSTNGGGGQTQVSGGIASGTGVGGSTIISGGSSSSTVGSTAGIVSINGGSALSGSGAPGAGILLATGIADPTANAGTGNIDFRLSGSNGTGRNGVFLIEGYATTKQPTPVVDSALHMYFDSTTNQTNCSENGSAWKPCFSSSTQVNGVGTTGMNLSNSTPAAASNGFNVHWQKDASNPTNVSAYLLTTDMDSTTFGSGTLSAPTWTFTTQNLGTFQLQGATSTVTNTIGTNMSVIGGTGNGSGNGGTVLIRGGNSGSSGNGGQTTINTGASTGTGTTSGTLILTTAGILGVTFKAGDIQMFPGVNGDTVSAGANISIKAGRNSGGNAALNGTVTVAGGDCANCTNTTLANVTVTGTQVTGSTNISGSGVSILGGLGTGNSTPTRVDIQGPALGTASGTSAQAEVVRTVFNATKTGLTSGGAASLVSTSFPTAPSAVGGHIIYSVEFSDGTDVCMASGTVNYSAVDKAGTVTSTVTPTEVTKCTGTATIADAWATTAAVPTVLQVTPTITNMGAITVNRITYTVFNDGQGAPTIQ